MNAREFFDLVDNMRSTQKEYFRTKSPYVLEESKRLERLVDNEIKRAKDEVKKRQEPELKFDES